MLDIWLQNDTNYNKGVVTPAQKLGLCRGIKISAKMLKIAISKFKYFYLHENGSNSVVFGPIHRISFAHGHWQAVLGVGWGNLEWSPWFVVKFWGRSKKFKILRFKNLLPKRLCRAATTKPRQIERSGFFLLDHNGKTRIYRLVPGSFDVPLRRKTRFSDSVWWLPPPLNYLMASFFLTQYPMENYFFTIYCNKCSF